ncbi:MAG: hypothetical protein H5T82_04375 [Demequina sp.]|uniref:hypothetical protein n=1 Tax=Demequina sp. TaxID=2050685 RepID=UPI0019A37C0E|nr:hypothetical protein [Demequina sp.]MBC7298110.1 hypothetical protein [Demequina sp.]
MLVRVLSVSALALLGVAVTTVGVGAHRSLGYFGAILGILIVLLVGVFAKAWQGWSGFIAYAVAWGVMAMVYASQGPGGSILVAADVRGKLWLYGGVAAVAIVAAVPRTVIVGRDVAS